MNDEGTSCNFLAATVIRASRPAEPVVSMAVRRWKKRASPVYRRMLALLSPPHQEGALPASDLPAPVFEPLNVEPGDLVEVKSLEEIRETLDHRNKYMGLYFMPEMERYCGQRFTVFKKAVTIKLESTGEVRRLRSPTVFLEGVHCEGELQQGCDRGCFHFWREAWLRRVPGASGAR